MEQKTKKNKKSKKTNYQSSYLILILIAFLLSETLLISFTTPADWTDAVSILDMKKSVSETFEDVAIAFTPITNSILAVNNFYQAAAEATMQLLDISGSENEVAQVFNTVSDFYGEASLQMAQVLDISSPVVTERVAGISITAY